MKPRRLPRFSTPPSAPLGVVTSLLRAALDRLSGFLHNPTPTTAANEPVRVPPLRPPPADLASKVKR